MRKEVIFNQITLITDGLSNQGISAIEAARIANQFGLMVNVLGISNGESSEIKGEREIKNIAAAGGGFSQVELIENISGTIQTITRKALTNTIQEVVYSQLNQIFSENNPISIPPSKRVQAYEVIDNIAEHSHLNVLILIDQSTSMFNKMQKIKDVILDFQLSLQSRSGSSQMCVATFPEVNNIIDIKLPWTDTKESIDLLLRKLRPNGNTPTGPAILASMKYFHQNINKYNKIDGVLDEYII